jgi:hypothetical protein
MRAFRLTTTGTLLALALTGAATAQVIDVEPRSIDFGSMKQQEDRVSFVTVTNKGAGLLVIEDIKADCGCTVPEIMKKQLAPGESTEMEIRFNSKKFHGKTYKSVQIMSNDPVNAVTDVMIMADVFAPLVIVPANERIGFTRSLRGETVTKPVTFRVGHIPELELKVGKSRQGLFEVKAVNGVDGDPQFAHLEVTVPADMAPGRHRDIVRVETNVPERPTVDIEMQAWVVQELVVSPEQVSFRYKKNFNQTVRVAPFQKGTEFRVTGAEIDLPEIAVEVVETIPGAEAKVLMSGAPVSSTDPRAVAADGRMKGTLKIFTDLPNTPVIEVPVTYMVRM